MIFKSWIGISVLCLLAAGCSQQTDRDWEEVFVNNLSTADMVTEVYREAERIVTSHDRSFLEIDIRAFKVSEHMEAGIRISLDSGTWQYVMGACLGDTGSGNTQLWRVDLEATGWQHAEYAVYLRDLVNYRVYWDNNNFQNYHAESAPAVRWIRHGFRDSRFLVLMEVHNRDDEKHCGARVTGDDWISEATDQAYYLRDSDREGFELWGIELDTYLPEWSQLSQAAGIELALFCSYGTDGERHWDDNDGNNYRFDRVEPPRVVWRSPFERAREMVMSLDGSVFLLSGSADDQADLRRVSGFAPDGFFRFAREFNGQVDTLRWVDDPGFLLVSVASGEMLTWMALDDLGQTLWELQADLNRVVEREETTFLVGPAGAAVLSLEQPAVIGPSAGCEGTPMVNRDGRMLCRSQGQIVEYDLHSRDALRTLEDGIPWAVSHWGHAAILSEDRTRLTGYGLDGEQIWTLEGLQVAQDTYDGVGRECPNHAHRIVALYLNQDQESRDQGQSYVAGINLATGAEFFHTELNGHFYNPCPDRDGRFYFAETNQRDESWLYQLEYDGIQQTISLGLNGGLVQVLPDGRILRRVWPYQPGTLARIVLTDDGQMELFSKALQVDGDPDNPVLAATNGRRLSVYAQGEITTYGL